MKRLLLYMILSFVLAAPSHGQKDCIVPEPGVLTRVSVNPATGYTELNWSLSTSTGIAAYIIYSHTTGYWVTVDTIWDPAATSYSFDSPGIKYFSESYVVSSYRLPKCTSPFSNTLSTIFCTAQVDTCHRQITLSWNKYSSIPVKPLAYRILVSKNGSPMTETYITDTINKSFIINDFEVETNYCFIIKADLEGGKESYSNKVCLATHMLKPPSWINADYATVNDQGKVGISATYDATSELSSFRIERKTGSSGTFETIASPVSTSGRIEWTDTKADTSRVNYYRVSSINNCGVAITVSNLATNLHLALAKKNEVIYMKWNPYSAWNGTADRSAIFVNSGNGWNERWTVPASDTSFSVKYSELMYEAKGETVCFRVEARETGNPYGTQGTSMSNPVCIKPVENITVPNTFTPDHNLVNDTFRPVLSFTPESYRLVITDIRKKVVFETSDYTEEWDGTDNGSSLPSGVYLWFLKVVSGSGKTYSRSGTVNIVFNN